jgi:diaminohydroxyphosphoribosylaminopyrimidine deaminase / 5-amino-6-(5-phosphoribosylamino)uracil reductase
MKALPADDQHFMRLALRLARRAIGMTSPNPMVGAVLVKHGTIIGRGWHRYAGGPHAEIEAIADAQSREAPIEGATMYVTLEPCCTQGRTPPCTQALINARLARVVAATTDANPKHSGRGFKLLAQAGISVSVGVLEDECRILNQAFNHFIVRRRPFVTVKAAMTCDGKIATATGESKWITGTLARQQAMLLRQQADAILVGINTILADDPQLTVRLAHPSSPTKPKQQPAKVWRRIILDTSARTPLSARVVSDAVSAATIVVVGSQAPAQRIEELRKHVQVWQAPIVRGRIDLDWLLDRLGKESVVHLLVEGGGTVNASFLMQNLAHQVAFFLAPKILGGHSDLKAVGGFGAKEWSECLRLDTVRWRRLGQDLYMTAIIPGGASVAAH